MKVIEWAGRLDNTDIARLGVRQCFEDVRRERHKRLKLI
jgi:hypothetical protein